MASASSFGAAAPATLDNDGDAIPPTARSALPGGAQAAFASGTLSFELVSRYLSGVGVPPRHSKLEPDGIGRDM